jgi:branched-chain amino acid transport system ATP-binding protein
MSESATSPDAVLTTRSLSKRFGGVAAVEDVDFAFGSHRVHAVIGPNGAGKTTLFNLMSGALKPSSGRVTLKGRDITGLKPHHIARLGLARKFQITRVFHSLTVADNVLLAVRGRGSRRLRGGDGADVDRLLAEMRLTDRRDALTGELSHGEQQRLEIAMSLGTGAEVLLLDEPTSGMTLEERAAMSTMLRDISASRTIVITEHDFEFIKSVADTVTVLDRGRKLAEGSVADIENDRRVREIYLGVDADA